MNKYKKKLSNLSTSKNNITNKLQQDIIKIADKTVFINPFLYWRRFDENTNRWLREPGQMSEEQLQPNRNRFYPEIDWSYLSSEEKLIKDATVEMFLKTMDLISTFHPSLTSGQLLEVERKMSITKKLPFENWVKKSFARKAKIELQEKRRFERDRFFRNWREWLSLEETKKALFPIIVIIFMSAFVGWLTGVSKNSCNPYFEPNSNSQISNYE